MMQGGEPGSGGARWTGDGVNFTLFSAAAEAVELCLFDAQGHETGRHAFSDERDGCWFAFLPGCTPGQRYGYRVHGPYDPLAGLRFNPHKLLIDPYAQILDGDFLWTPSVYDFEPDRPAGEWVMNTLDSAASVPKAVVPGPNAPMEHRRPAMPWAQTIIYEANVRGFSMRHPDVPEIERGKFTALSNRKVLDYLRALGVTSIELMPVHYFIDEAALVRRGLKNFWGYNSLNFFTPAARYSTRDAAAEFKDMVRCIHDAGLEVILDVVYNHTGEGDEIGPTLSFRGIDNLAYYRVEKGNPGRYINDSGCGNSINADHPQVQNLIISSLRYWRREMGVDGFRFDLAAALGRREREFDPQHPLLHLISSDSALEGAKLIAEPWDTGAGGYQLGRFPAGWSELNDRYRDSARRFWLGEEGEAGEFARRVHGSSDIFEPGGRNPRASINFINNHDGLVLADLVEPGSAGRRQRLNMFASLLFSQGVPLFLAGDEFGNSQQGDDNAYNQDNETGWLDWSQLDADPGFQAKIAQLVNLRRTMPLLREEQYLHGGERSADGEADIAWLHPDGRIMGPVDWQTSQAFALLLMDAGAVAILFNASPQPRQFLLPDIDSNQPWRVAFSSSEYGEQETGSSRWQLPEASILCLQSGE